MIRLLALWLAGLGIMTACAKPKAQPVRLAAASSFGPAAKQIATLMPQHCAARLNISTGPTGRLTTQIRNGAPFDVFVAVGKGAAAHLNQGGGVNDSTVIAQSPLVLWQPEGTSGKTGVLALARAGVAPYGAAAEQALAHMKGRADWPLPPKRVYGQSAAQAFAFAATGAADAALVPLSLARAGQVPKAQIRTVPSAWYAPVPTVALLLHKRTGARCLYDLLRSEALATLLREAGYPRS